VQTEILPLAATSAAPIPSPATSPGHQLIDAWLAGLSPRTVEAYRGDLAHFAAWWLPHEPTTGGAVERLMGLSAGFANEIALKYVNDQLGAGLATATVKRRLAALRSVVKLARMLGRVSWSIEVKAPRVEARRDTRGPDPADRKKLWRYLAKLGDGPRARRDRALFALLFDLGLRRAEVLALDVGSIDLADGSIRVVGKGRREAERLTLPPQTRRALGEWVEVLVGEDRPDTPLFFPIERGPRGRVRRLTGSGLLKLVAATGKRAGCARPLRPHGLRHAAITAALEAGSDVRDVRKFSRHKKLETVLLYDDARDDVAGKIARSVAKERK
jgi:integrase/recombinase XerC